MLRRRWRALARYLGDFRNGLRVTLTPTVLAFFILIVAAAVAGQLAIVRYLAGDYGLEAEQAIQWRLARTLVPEFSRGAQPLSRPELAKKLNELHKKNYEIEGYVLDTSGYVVASDPDKRTPVLPLLSPEPLEEALDWGQFKRGIKADDPMDPKGSVYFSVARLPQGQFLFIALRGRALAQMTGFTKGKVVGTASLGILLLGTVIPLAAASVIFTRLFRRIRSMEESASNLAHDLKAPLASTRALLETMLLHDRRLSPEKRAEFLETSLKSLGSLSELANNLMEIWRYESSESLRAATYVALNDLVSDVAAKFRPQAELREIRIVIRLSARTPFVLGNVGALERVLSNLIDNAIEHSPSGGEIAIAVSRSWFSRIHCAVENEGGTLSRRDAARIFERFYSSRKAIDGHSGLGLVICRKIVEAHGGKIWVKSNPGRSVAFIFSVPEAPRRAAAPMRAAAQAGFLR